jgi:hypothetical protein
MIFKFIPSPIRLFLAALCIFIIPQFASAKNLEVLLKKFDERDQIKLLADLNTKMSTYTGKGFLDNSFTSDAEGIWFGRFTKNFGGEVFEVGVEVVSPALNKNYSKPANEMAVVVNYLQGGVWRTAVHMEVVSPVLYFNNKLQGVGNFHRPLKKNYIYDFSDDYYGWIFFDLPWQEGYRDFAYFVVVQCPEAGACKIIEDNMVAIRWSKYASLEQLHKEIRRPDENFIRKSGVPYQVDPFFEGMIDGSEKGIDKWKKRGYYNEEEIKIPTWKDLGKD